MAPASLANPRGLTPEGGSNSTLGRKSVAGHAGSMLPEADPSFLRPTAFVDADHPRVRAFANEAIGVATGDAEKVQKLFRAVRERFRYDPYSMTLARRDYRASAVLERDRAYCIPKAVVLAAAARAVGIPARLGFADVTNHLSSPKLLEHLGTDLFAYHGYAELWVEGTPYKLTPAFNASLCARFGVGVLDFDAEHPADAVLQPFDGEGRPYMSYVTDRGLFVDLPFDAIMETFAQLYPVFGRDTGALDAAFHPGVEGERG